MSAKDLAPFYSKMKDRQGSQILEVKETEEESEISKFVHQQGSDYEDEDGEEVDEQEEERREQEQNYTEQRKSAAWWGSKPNQTDPNQSIMSIASSRERSQSHDKPPLNSAHVLERLMRQTAFNDGDQELLASAFEAIDEDGSGRVDYEEFWEALAPITHNLREQDRQELFMKVDQDCSGAVDLFDFLNFFLVTTYDQLQRPATRSGSNAREGKTTGGNGNHTQPTPGFFATAKEAKPPHASPHKDIIIGMFHNRHPDQYATVSRDGVLATWSKELKFQRSFKVADPRQSLGGNRHTSAGFIQATCMTPTTGLVGVASMKRIVRFYDCSSAERGKHDETNTTTPVFQFKPSQSASMCLKCAALSDGRELLMRGGDEGTVTCQFLRPGWHRVEGAAMGTFNQQKFREEFAEKFKYQPHASWVTKADYVDDVASVVSTGYDSVLAMMDLETRKIKWRLDSSKVRFSSMSERAHTRGIRTWDFSSAYSVFCTGGVERTVHLWSPFVNRPVGALRGANSSTVDIKVNDNDCQIVTLGADKTIKVWDVRNLKCVTTITDSTNQLPENAFFGLLYDRTAEQLITGSGRPQAYALKRAVTARVTYYHFVAVATCSRKNLVAVADESNEIRMFRAGSGRGVSTFCGCPPDTGSVTALAFDSDEIRLLVAVNDGYIRLFNHGNGMLLKQFALADKADVGAMLASAEQGERLLYAATDTKQLYVWKDTDDATSDRAIPHAHLAQANADQDTEEATSDIADVCGVPPETMVTCSFDGKLSVWGGGIMLRTMHDPDNFHKPLMERGMLRLCAIPVFPTPLSNISALSPKLASLRAPSVSFDPRRGSVSPPPLKSQTVLPQIRNVNSNLAGRRGSTVQVGPGRAAGNLNLSGPAARSGSVIGGDGQAPAYVIASAGSDGHVHFWDVTPPGCHLFKVQVFLPAKSGFGVVQICTDDTASFLFCGDAHGIVQVLDISQLRTQGLDGSSVIPLFDFRAHDRPLLRLDFIQSSGKGQDGSGALMTATKDEVRLWTIEGEHIGQFGRDSWDLSRGHRMPLRKDDVTEIGDEIEEDAGGSNARLSELWLSPDKISAPEDIPESLHRDSSFEASLSDEGESRDDSPPGNLNFFATDATVDSISLSGPASGPVTVGPGGRFSKSPVMPRLFQKTKRLDINMFGRIPLTDLADTQWVKANLKRDAPGQPLQFPPSSNGSPPPRPSKHRVRMDAALAELRHTPVEVRPGLLSASAYKPTTPEIYGLFRGKVALPDRSQSSML